MPENTQSVGEVRYTLGATLDLSFEDGRSETVTISHLKVKDYGRTLFAIDKEDEPQAVANAFDKPRAWAESLTPESYQKAADVFREVNSLFFAYAGRILGMRDIRKSASQSEQ